MSNSQQEIATPLSCKQYLPVLLLASVAGIILSTAGIVIYAYSSVKNYAFLFLFLLLLTAIPIFFLIKIKTFKPLSVFAFFVPLICLLVLLVALYGGQTMIIKTSTGAERTVIKPYCFFICLCVFVFVSCFTIYYKRRDRLDLASSLFCLIAGAGIILSQYFYFNFSAKTILGVIISSIVLVFLVFYAFVMPKDSRISTRYITYTATFSALSVVFKIIGNSITNTLAFIPASSVKLTFVYMPWVLSGIVLGPLGGMLSAGIGDFLGQIILPSGGAFFYLTFISNILFPVFPALAYRFLPLKKSQEWLKILIGLIVSTLVCTLGLGTLALSIQYNSSFMAFFVTRGPQTIIIGINYFLILSLMPALKRTKLVSIRKKEKIYYV